MFKKSLMILSLLVLLPAMANAWTINAKAMTKGGTILPAGVTSVLAGTETYNLTVTADANYSVDKVVQIIGTTRYTLAGAGTTYTANRPPAKTSTTQVLAYFKKNVAGVTVLNPVGQKGVVSATYINPITGKPVAAAGNVPTGVVVSITAKPNFGYQCTAITVTGASVTTSIPGGMGVPATGSFTMGTGPVTIGATFGQVASITAKLTASAINTYVGGPAITLDATNTLAAPPVSSYTFAVTGVGSANTTLAELAPSVPGKQLFTVQAGAVGPFTITVTANNGTPAQAFVNVAVVLPQVIASRQCTSCHAGRDATIVDLYNAGHGAVAGGPSCQACHNPAGTLSHAYKAVATIICTPCHIAADVVTTNVVNCAHCHSANGNIHGVSNNTKAQTTTSCIACHDVAAPKHANGVNDNNGVRAIATEFTKRSHHITGASPTDAQCVVCHLEGNVVGTGVVVDPTKHMVDDKIHLRNADNNADLVWSGSEHTNMDNFCFSCHDLNGAAAVPATFAGVTGFTGTASNPFGDTLTNGYDQVARAGVVDVQTAFTTTNASHHAVSGQRYKYRFSTAANAAVWVARDAAHRTMPDASEIAEGHTGLDGEVILATEFEETMTGDFSFDTVSMQPATGPGTLPKGEGEATLYEAEKFVSSYVPLGATLSVADNSTLHCGDCHTVGQWKAGSSTNADGSTTAAAIGAHGSNNEYLLRNSLGTDALHNNLTYVCFNCHKAGLNIGAVATVTLGFGQLHPNQHKNQVLGYATTHAVSAFHIQCLADSADNIGRLNRLSNSWEGDKVKVYEYAGSPTGTLVLPTASTSAAFTFAVYTANSATPAAYPSAGLGSDKNSGNITGIACTNCHNSGLRSGFGGIHGGDNTYTDGLGRSQRSYRFMPGMGNYKYAPPGGWDGKDVSNPDLVTVAGNAAGVPGGKPMGGCYTNGDPSKGSTDFNPGYSACNHHGTAVGAKIAATGIYNGGSAQVGNGSGTSGLSDDVSLTKTTWEPTVREATAGNALVTRPLKY